jgi:carboxypeptidase C (cathepsin A)
LDLADLVFIDPVGTGYSISIGAGKDADFWGLREDARSIAQFIRQWITKNKRWNAPKYIAGESFGTTRAVAVTDQLEKDGQNLALNGLILISQALDYTGSTPVHDNIIAYITYLPTMAATAWYHDCAGKGEKLENFIDRARKFATDKYAPALLKGNQLTGKELSYIASGLSEFTGLDTTYILQANLRILTHRFRKELMRNKGLVVGRLDSRYAAGEDDVHAEGSTLGDVASNSISSAYSAAINHYLSNNLKVEMDRPYLISNRKLSQKWNWRPVPESARWEPSYVNVARKLGDALRRNSDLNVMVANGYYDFATPFFDAEYTFARHGILKDRVRMLYYEAGHMMYTHEPDLKKLTSDIRTFLSNSLH